MNLTPNRIAHVINNLKLRWPKRRAVKVPPKAAVPEYCRVAQLGGEWWVLASDGTRTIPCGDDELQARSIANTINTNAAAHITNLQRAKRNRELIAARVREIGGVR